MDGNHKLGEAWVTWEKDTTKENKAVEGEKTATQLMIGKGSHIMYYFFVHPIKVVMTMPFKLIGYKVPAVMEKAGEWLVDTLGGTEENDATGYWNADGNAPRYLEDLQKIANAVIWPNENELSAKQAKKLNEEFKELKKRAEKKG